MQYIVNTQGSSTLYTAHVINDDYYHVYCVTSKLYRALDYPLTVTVCLSMFTLL